MTAVYTLASPGGWHILGRTPAALWSGTRTPPAVLAPGDKVRFTPIGMAEFDRLAAQSAAGKLELEGEHA
jgi:allophanate hydrolase subunit 1